MTNFITPVGRLTFNYISRFEREIQLYFNYADMLGIGVGYASNVLHQANRFAIRQPQYVDPIKLARGMLIDELNKFYEPAETDLRYTLQSPRKEWPVCMNCGADLWKVHGSTLWGLDLKFCSVKCEKTK